MGNDIRMDFQTVAIFADGRFAVSFLDSTTGDSPALAIELGTTLGSKVQYASTTTPKLGTPYVSYTFEEDDEGWTSDGTGTWLRQQPGAASDGSDDPSGYGWAVAGPLYADSLDTSVTSPPIATVAGDAVVQFMVKFDTEPGFDYLHAEWSADNTNWLPLSDFTGRNAGYPNWQKVTLGFDSPGGNVWVRFRLTSDQLCSGLDPYCGSTWAGVHVDSVIVGRQATR